MTTLKDIKDKIEKHRRIVLPMKTITCECGKEFEVKITSNRVFCSQSCSNRNNGKIAHIKHPHLNSHTKDGDVKIKAKLKKYNSMSYVRYRKSLFLKKRIESGIFTPHPNKLYRGGFKKDLGHYVRSSWEANICRTLKYFGVLYEYESKKCRFKLGDSIYISDIFIPEMNLYIEVKGYLRKESRSKLYKFVEAYPNINMKIIDGTSYYDIKYKFSKMVPGWE